MVVSGGQAVRLVRGSLVEQIVRADGELQVVVHEVARRGVRNECVTRGRVLVAVENIVPDESVARDSLEEARESSLTQPDALGDSRFSCLVLTDFSPCKPQRFTVHIRSLRV